MAQLSSVRSSLLIGLTVAALGCAQPACAQLLGPGGVAQQLLPPTLLNQTPPSSGKASPSRQPVRRLLTTPLVPGTASIQTTVADIVQPVVSAPLLAPVATLVPQVAAIAAAPVEVAGATVNGVVSPVVTALPLGRAVGLVAPLGVTSGINLGPTAPPPLAVAGNFPAGALALNRPPTQAAAIPSADISGVATTAVAETAPPLTDLRRLRAQALIRDHATAIEADGHGNPVLRGEILAVAPSAEALTKARRAGFTVREESVLDGLDLRLVTLAAPAGLSAVQALTQLRALDRAGSYDFNHIYQPSGDLGARIASPAAAPPTSASRIRVGLIDGGVSARQPALAGVKLVQEGFAGPAQPTAHAAAVASLLVGRQGAFRGAAPGAALYVADVYGGSSSGGSAAELARALAWMARQDVPVINISLVGPPNLTLGAAVAAMVARGHVLVAAVGNDGPAAPPLYPAAYPGVVAVTAVDGAKRLLPEAGRGTHVDFAAPGADMAAAAADGGFVSVRGTSFAAPLAAGRLAALIEHSGRAPAALAIAALGREAQDLGPRGPDRSYGRGLVGFELRIAPTAVAARGPLLQSP